MNRFEAIQTISNQLTDELVFHANGHICRESFSAKDRPQNFYMIGSMGLAPCIGLGVAMERPDKKVVIYDGDGSILMNLGALGLTGSLKPKNFVHIVFDNETYGSTGEQPTLSKYIPLEKVALDCGYRISEKVDWNENLNTKLKKVLHEDGPCFLLVKVQSSDGENCQRVSLTPVEIADRIRSILS